MKPVIFVIGAAVLALWSLFAWIGHAVLVGLGGWGSANADLLPVPPEWVVAVSNLLGWASDFSGVIVVTVWAVGAILIALGTLIGTALAGRVNRGSLDKARRFIGR